MPSNFKFNNGGDYADFDDVFIRRDIFSTGGVRTWGNDGSGQLGDTTTVNKSSPVQVTRQSTAWKQISARGSTAHAIKADGTLWAWGYGFGRLGIDTSPPTVVSSPIQVGLLTNWYQISTGSNTVGAIKTDGTLWMWVGSNESGQLGNGTSGGSVTLPNPPIQIGTDSNWKQISCGGSNAQSPNQNSVGAIKTNGALWVWGDNGYNQLGIPGGLGFSTPVQLGALTNWKQVSFGDLHSGAVKTDGTLWMWGINGAGQIGKGDTGYPGLSASSPTQIGALTNWKLVCCGYNTTFAIKTDGSLWAWGDNSTGKLGLGNTNSMSSPVQVGTLNNWKSISTCGGHAVAVKNDGTLWAWGQNTDGQLGNSVSTWLSSPIQIGSLTNWKQVATGVNFTAALVDNS